MNYTKEEFETGQLLLIDKPIDWTSFDVVQKLRNIIKVKKIGHAGTLDPLATGLLIICTGKFTKKINEYMAREKEYTGTFTLGASTPTYDLESEPENFKPWEHLKQEEIHLATKIFTGTIQQVPPTHSAIKIGGRRVYELARQGKEVNLEPRTVTISEFVIEKINGNMLEFRVVCSTGTYIRSLAHDFGNSLESGGYLSSLCRARIGEFLLKDAESIEGLKNKVEHHRMNG